jgi:hypothetical protein
VLQRVLELALVAISVDPLMDPIPICGPILPLTEVLVALGTSPEP